MAGDPKAATEWRAAYERVSELSRAAGEGGMAVTVPATPDWTAKDLLAHMVGVGVDAVAGTAPPSPTDEWTQGHVDARADRSVDDLLDEWAGQADAIETFVRETEAGPVGDIVIHEQDLRGALQQPGAQDTEGAGLVRAFSTGGLGSAVDDSLPPLVLRATDGDWTWRSSDTDAEPGAVVEAPLFDLSRAVLSRRTADQLRSWTTQGDVTPYLDAFAGVGPLPQTALPE